DYYCCSYSGGNTWVF
nr:immunoglobulin light chain junction region [Macaca mulatta]MOX18889.1 immunoglobulin light chain junction region [Macaca mulatta]